MEFSRFLFLRSFQPLISSFQNAQHFENWLSGSEDMAINARRSITRYEARPAFSPIYLYRPKWAKNDKKWPYFAKKWPK